MPRYVDGYILPIPKKNVETYRRMARQAGKIWIKHGALEYIEAAGDDLNIKGVVSFAKTLKCKPGETVIFAFVVYKSRAHRDRVNAKVMADPQIKPPDMENLPMDIERMVYGGFRAVVDL
jgi:uncharacterized protein YbaA (DUF1428 family)